MLLHSHLLKISTLSVYKSTSTEPILLAVALQHVNQHLGEAFYTNGGNQYTPFTLAGPLKADKSNSYGPACESFVTLCGFLLEKHFVLRAEMRTNCIFSVGPTRSQCD